MSKVGTASNGQMKHEFADDNASRLTRGWQINHEVAYLRASTAVAGDAISNLRTNVSLSDGSNNFTAIALDNLGRTDTNTVSAWLPAAAAMKYDLNGNLTNDSRRALIYDDENQLTTIIVTNASGTITKSEFTYDGKMRRRLRKEYTLASGIWNPVSEVRYVYDGMLVVQERHYAPQLSTNNPQQLVTYTRGRDLSGTLEGAGGIGGLLARTEQPVSGIGYPASALYHADGNGNVTCLIATNSVVLARYLYDPYGNILSQSGSLAEANLYRFSSKEWHVASGLVYYGYRFYASEWQRWVNRDPLGETGGKNMFGFGGNAPPHNIDSFGLYNPILTPGGIPISPGHGRPDPVYPPLTPIPGAIVCYIFANGIIFPIDCASLSGGLPGIRCSNAPPAQPAGQECDPAKDKPTPSVPAGTEWKYCPGLGRIQVSCTSHRQCQWVKPLNAPLTGRWLSVRLCPCPTTPAAPAS